MLNALSGDWLQKRNGGYKFMGIPLQHMMHAEQLSIFSPASLKLLLLYHTLYGNFLVFFL